MGKQDRMQSRTKTFLLVLIIMSITEANEMMEEMMIEMREVKGYLVATKDEMLSIKDDLSAKDVAVQKLKRDMKAKDEIIQMLEAKDDQIEKMNRVKDDTIQRLKIKYDQLETDAKAKGETLKNMEKVVSFLKDPPYTFFCSFQHSTHISSQSITYSKLLYSSTNVEGAAMSISTGVFTSGWPGSYTATWSLSADVDVGQDR